MASRLILQKRYRSTTKKQFHHIYPRAHLKRIGASGNHNSIANICILAASENRLISDDNPHVYLPKCVTDLGNQATAVFATNLLPDPASFHTPRRHLETSARPGRSS
jgi:hypothetical protein